MSKQNVDERKKEIAEDLSDEIKDRDGVSVEFYPDPDESDKHYIRFTLWERNVGGIPTSGKFDDLVEKHDLRYAPGAGSEGVISADDHTRVAFTFPEVE